MAAVQITLESSLSMLETVHRHFVNITAQYTTRKAENPPSSGFSNVCNLILFFKSKLLGRLLAAQETGSPAPAVVCAAVGYIGLFLRKQHAYALCTHCVQAFDRSLAVFLENLEPLIDVKPSHSAVAVRRHDDAIVGTIADRIKQ